MPVKKGKAKVAESSPPPDRAQRRTREKKKLNAYKESSSDKNESVESGDNDDENDDEGDFVKVEKTDRRAPRGKKRAAETTATSKAPARPEKKKKVAETRARTRVGGTARDEKSEDKKDKEEKGKGKEQEEEKEKKKEEAEDEEEEDEEEDWEEVVPEGEPRSEEADREVPASAADYQTVEITFDAPAVKMYPRKAGISKEQRLICQQAHMLHLLCLLGNALIRNSWCNHDAIAAIALSLVPQKIQKSIHPTLGRSSIPIVKPNMLRELAAWWHSIFTVSGPGIMNGPWVAEPWKFLHEAESANLFQAISSPEDLLDRLHGRNGDRDVSAQLFVAVCRALGFETRLIASLQPITHKARSFGDADSKTSDTESVRSASAASAVKSEDDDAPKKPKRRKTKSADGEAKSNLRKEVVEKIASLDAGPPIFWAEVWSPTEDRWLCVDAVDGRAGSAWLATGDEMKKNLVPDDKCVGNVLAYVVACDRNGRVKDVTRKYTQEWSTKTKKLRLPLIDKKNWWENTIRRYKSKEVSERATQEDKELEDAEMSEAMPKTIQLFNNHPLYALERHLKKFEILYPMEPVLGTIRNEKVYPRSCVRQCHTVETWLKEGRSVKDGEEAMKFVKSRAVTTNTKRAMNLAELNEAPDVGIFAEWQTEIYVAPPVVDGKVPKNQYNNIDLFKPWMVPKGAVHIPINGTGKVAKKLGVDYAEAVVGFEFHSRRCVPSLLGIVVPIESEQFIRQTYEEMETEAQRKKYEKLQKESQQAKRNQIKKKAIEERLTREYDIDDVEEASEAELEEGESEMAHTKDDDGASASNSNTAAKKKRKSAADDDDKEEDADGCEDTANAKKTSAAPVQKPRSFAAAAGFAKGHHVSDASVMLPSEKTSGLKAERGRKKRTSEAPARKRAEVAKRAKVDDDKRKKTAIVKRKIGKKEESDEEESDDSEVSSLLSSGSEDEEEEEDDEEDDEEDEDDNCEDTSNEKKNSAAPAQKPKSFAAAAGFAKGRHVSNASAMLPSEETSGSKAKQGQRKQTSEAPTAKRAEVAKRAKVEDDKRKKTDVGKRKKGEKEESDNSEVSSSSSGSDEDEEEEEEEEEDTDEDAFEAPAAVRRKPAAPRPLRVCGRCGRRPAGCLCGSKKSKETASP